MKRIFLVLMTMLFGVFSIYTYAGDDRQAADAARQQAQWEGRQGNASTIISQQNSHVTREGYTPSDLAEQGRREGISCDENGNLGVHSATGYCRNFKSRSEGTSWRVRFASQHGSSAERIFKIVNGHPTLWVKYNAGNQRTEYVSPGAQQYAAANGGGGQIAGRGMPQVPQSARNGACDHLSGKARGACEVGSELLPNIGGLLKGW